MRSSEAQVSLSKLPLEVLNQMGGAGSQRKGRRRVSDHASLLSKDNPAHSTKHVGGLAGCEHHRVSIRALVSFATANFTISTRQFTFFLYFCRFSHLAESGCNFYHQLQGRIVILTPNLL